MKKYFPYEIYIHHKLSMIFISITCLTFTLVCSLLPETSSEEKLNTYQKVENEFGNYYYSILLVLVFVVGNFIYSYSVIYSKVLIQLKNMSLHLLIICVCISD